MWEDDVVEGVHQILRPSIMSTKEYDVLEKFYSSSVERVMVVPFPQGCRCTWPLPVRSIRGIWPTIQQCTAVGYYWIDSLTQLIIPAFREAATRM